MMKIMDPHTVTFIEVEDKNVWKKWEKEKKATKKGRSVAIFFQHSSFVFITAQNLYTLYCEFETLLRKR